MKKAGFVAIALAALAAGISPGCGGTTDTTDAGAAADTGTTAGKDASTTAGADAAAPGADAASGGADAGADAASVGADAGADAATARPDAASAGADAGVISFQNDVVPIFTANGCTGCHGGSGGLFLSTTPYANLVNVTSNCDPTKKRVVPGDTAKSLIWLKTSNDAAKCGSSMPLGGTPLKTGNPADFAKLETWILQGALNN